MQRVDRQRRGDVGGAASRSAPASASASTAVETCVPLISARPSFGAERDRREPGRGERVARRRASRRPTTSPSPISTSARCASGARSPLAPTEPRLGTRGCTPRLSSATSASSVSTRMPEKPLASTLARSAIDARTARTGSGSSTPAAWLRSRLSCSAARSALVDARLGEGAEAGVDAVDRRVAVGLAHRRRRARRRHARAPRARAPTSAPIVGDRHESSSVRSLPSSRIIVDHRPDTRITRITECIGRHTDVCISVVPYFRADLIP